MSGFVHPDRANNNPAFDAKQVMMAHGEFDFGSGMSLPPARYHLNATNDYNHPGFKEEAPFHSGYGSFNGAPTNRAVSFQLHPFLLSLTLGSHPSAASLAPLTGSYWTTCMPAASHRTS